MLCSPAYYKSLTKAQLIAELVVRDGQVLEKERMLRDERDQANERLRDSERLLLNVVEKLARIIGGK